MRSRWVCLIALVGCGRLGFSSRDEVDATPDTVPDAWVCGGAYRALVLRDHPTAYWRLDETGGTTFVDATGHGYDATISGSPTFSAACTSSARDQFVGLTGSSGAIAAQPFTSALDNASIEFWVQMPSTENWPSLFGRDSWDYDYGLGMTPTNWSGAGGAYPVFGHYYNPPLTTCSTCGAQSTTGIADNAWHHVAGTVAMTGPGSYLYSIYVDGVLTGTSMGIEGATASPTGSLIIGTSMSFPFVGNVADLAFYDYALAPSQITSHYQTR